MSGLPEPERSAAVIAGVARYAHLPPLPAVSGNRTRLRETLQDPAVLGLPAQRCHEVPDPATSAELIDPVISAARQARDTLIVYYAGHGFVDHKGELFLTLPESKNGWRHTAVPYDWLRQAILEHSGARRRIVILDCCYSGRALEGMAEPGASLPAAASVNGTYLLTSASENVQALSPRGEECTAFTGELIAVLGQGIPDGGEFLTLDTVYGQVLHSLRSKGRPEPQEQDRGRIGRLPFVRNRRHAEGSSPPWPSADENPAASPPRRWHPQRHRRRYSLAAAGSVLLLSLAVSAAWLRPWDGGGDIGRCSKRATLLDWSDDLDKSSYEAQRVAGLSGLTLRDDSHLWALADTAPHRLYELSPGPEGEAAGVRVTGMTTLRDKDGSSLPRAKFDGEAVALEKGDDRVLVASKSGSSIGRYDLGSGRLVSSVEVPEEFRTEPEGKVRKNHGFESLVLSPGGGYLYAATERSLDGDDSRNGKSLVRILRYRSTPGGDYEPDKQFAFYTGRGLGLAELVAVGKNDLLTVERGHTAKSGPTLRVHRVVLGNDARDVTHVPSLQSVPFADFPEKRLLFDLSHCVSGTGQKQSEHPVENVQGAALRSPLKTGEHKGRPVLYLVSDDNGSQDEPTRFYALAVDLS